MKNYNNGLRFFLNIGKSCKWKSNLCTIFLTFQFIVRYFREVIFFLILHTIKHYCHLQKLIKMCTTSLVRFEKCKHHFEFPLWCSKHRTYHQLSEGNKCMSLKKILGASCYFTKSKIQKTKRSKEFWSPHSYDIGDHCSFAILFSTEARNGVTSS